MSPARKTPAKKRSSKKAPHTPPPAQLDGDEFVDDFLERKMPNTDSIDVSLDVPWTREWNGQVARRDTAAKLAQNSTNPDVVERASRERDAAQAWLDEHRATFHEKVRTFDLRGLAPRRYNDLVGLHQPTEEQRLAASKEGRTMLWNADTFLPALIAACLTSPKLNAGQVRRLIESDEFDGGEYLRLSQRCIELCTEHANVIRG